MKEEITLENWKEKVAYMHGFYDGQLVELKRQIQHEKNPEERLSWARRTLLELAYSIQDLSPTSKN